MSTTVKVTVKSQKIGQLAVLLSGAKRTELNTTMGFGVRDATRDYLRIEQGKRHTTAERLGGTITGHLGRAVDAIEKGVVKSDEDGATLTINHPGLGRAFHTVTIVPTNARALTIPVSGPAYGHRAGEFNLFLFRSKTTGNAFLAMRDPGADKNAKPLLMYLLRRSVTQKQDRTLLPSEAEWEKSARGSALEFLTKQGAFT